MELPESHLVPSGSQPDGFTIGIRDKCSFGRPFGGSYHFRIEREGFDAGY